MKSYIAVDIGASSGRLMLGQQKAWPANVKGSASFLQWICDEGWS